MFSLTRQRNHPITQPILTCYISLLLLAAIPSGQIEAASGTESAYSPETCFFTLPADLKRTVTCGRLSVPARRDLALNGEEETTFYQLPVARLKPKGRQLGPPVLFINGGPGQPSLARKDYARAFLAGLLDSSPWLEGRELIVFDARGIGAAEPAISCPEELYKLHLDDETKMTRKILGPCWRGLRKAGIDLASFNTTEAVADLVDLRRALGIEQWDLWGVSYGTRVALKLMESDPEGLRTVMLMGVFPPGIESSMNFTRSFDAALSKLFKNCARDLECARAYPNLRETFEELLEKRRRNPKAISALLTRTGWKRNHRFEMDDAMILSIVHSALYSATAIPELPAFIAEMAGGEYDSARILLDLADLVTFGPDSGILPRIIYYCNDNDPDVWSDRSEAIATYPQLANWLGDIDLGKLCGGWKLGDAEVRLDHSLPNSEHNVLILNGDLDPVTPSDWAGDVASQLPGSHFFRFPSNAHDTYLNACAQSIISQFLETPESRPDDACLAEETPLAFSVDSE